MSTVFKLPGGVSTFAWRGSLAEASPSAQQNELHPKLLKNRVYEKVVGKGRKKEYPHLQNPALVKSREETPNMETSEGLKTALKQEAELGVRKLLEDLQSLQEGDLKGLEQQVRETVFALGRAWMEHVLSHPTGQDEAASQPQVGSCGHPQRLVGQRPKQVLTLLGKITFQRAYYQCVLQDERSASAGNAAEQTEAAACQPSTCPHGHAPADGLWGVRGRRTSAGVQQVVSYLCQWRCGRYEAGWNPGSCSGGIGATGRYCPHLLPCNSCSTGLSAGMPSLSTALLDSHQQTTGRVISP